VEKVEELKATQTAAVEIQEKEVDELKVTQTAVANQVVQEQLPEATTTPEIICQLEPEGKFGILWKADTHQKRLGCPIQEEPFSGFFAEQPFENGFMFWAEEPDLFVVTIGEEKGTWEILEKTDFNPSGAGCEPTIAPPSSPDLVQPVRGFGGIWCDRIDIQKEIGYGTKEEYGVSDNLLQPFENGAILRDSNNLFYILFVDDRTYIREKFIE
jgi:hypothetical protein